MKAILSIIKRGNKKPSETWIFHTKTESLARNKINNMIWRTLRCAEKEFEAGDKTRMKALRGCTFTAVIMTEKGFDRDRWTYKPTVRY